MTATIAKVMVAGIGGASLGTEIFKCLKLAGTYEVFGCDISSTAYGLYEPGFTKTYRIDRDNYVAEVITACKNSGASWIIAGGEQPNALLSASSALLEKNGIRLIGNEPSLIKAFSDKEETFARLSKAGIPIPKTIAVTGEDSLRQIGLPCIIKPAIGSGGSVMVFFAVTEEEAMIYADFIRRNGSVPVAQEYVDADDGEFTIGVLSLPNGEIAGSIALQRALDAKLSVSYRGRGGLISSGYSQGRIDFYPDLCRQAEKIAIAIDSKGPINIQGRVRKGELLPFEINPRFSASTYLRALAGFNEVDIFLRYHIDGRMPTPARIVPGLYLRSLTEKVIPAENVA